MRSRPAAERSSGQPRTFRVIKEFGTRYAIVDQSDTTFAHCCARNLVSMRRKN